MLTPLVLTCSTLVSAVSVPVVAWIPVPTMRVTASVPLLKNIPLNDAVIGDIFIFKVEFGPIIRFPLATILGALTEDVAIT